MYGPEYCIPVRISRDDDPGAAAALARALGDCAGDYFIRVTFPDGPGPTLPLRAFINALGNRLGGVELDPATASELFSECSLPHFLAVRLCGDEPVQQLRALVGLATYRELRVVEAVSAAPCDEDSLHAIGFFRVFESSTDADPWRLQTDAHVDASGAVHVAGATSAASIPAVGLAAALASISHSAEAFRLAVQSAVPMTYRVPEPDDSGTVAYWLGGSQAFGMHMEAEESRAALGFRSEERTEFTSFLGEQPDEADLLFPSFRWAYPDLAPVPGRSLPPRRATSERCTFAAWLARGMVDEVGFSLGVRHELGDEPSKPNPALLDAKTLKAWLNRVDTRLCAALALLVESRVPKETKALALRALEVAATSDAKRTLKSLARKGVANAEAAFAGWERSHWQKRRESTGNSDPHARLFHLQSALEVFTSATSRECV